MSNTTYAPIPLSLYIHIPWCVQKCPYCDFNSHKAPEALPEEQYIDALLADLQSELPEIWGRRLHTIFIGGGTPSLFSAEALDKLLCGLRQLLPIRPDTEITLEANPGTFEQERFTAYREIGINRLSIGIQSYDPQQLTQLGRIHNSNEALKAASIAKQAGFDNFNLDLMFGLPQQTIDQALNDLQQAIDCRPTHLSWYQLTIEPNTLFHHQPPELPEDDNIIDMQEAGIELLNKNGYKQYEVSAYSQAGKECQHNLNYWQFGDYIGIGAGAHGKHTLHNKILRYQKHKHPQTYIEHALSGNARTSTTTIDSNDLVFEFMLNALRLKEGVERELFVERTQLDHTILSSQSVTAIKKGLLKNQSDRIVVSKKGWQFLNDAVECFL